MKNLLIIGGSHGIGEEIVKQNIDTYNVFNISRNEPKIKHEHLAHFPCDILTDDLPDLSDLDSIIYCPGSINLKPIQSLKEKDFLDDFEINVLGIIKVVKQYLRALKNGNSPSIVLFSSIAVNLGMPFHSSIAVAKAGVEALTKSLAAELAPKIRVNCIAPNITDTPLSAHILKNDKIIENIASKIPLRSILKAEEIAHMASFLISEKASAITGQIINVDGGMSTLKI